MDIQMQASKMILTTKFKTSMLNPPSLATFKLEPNGNNMFVLSNNKDKLCPMVDIKHIVISYLKHASYHVHTTHNIFVNIMKSPYIP